MVWQEDVKQVIMLTNLMEGIKVNINMKYLIDHVMSCYNHFRNIHLYFLVEMRAVLAKYTNNYGVR